MSKTYKDKANYARFHNRLDILDPSERELSNLMEGSASRRFGNHRTWNAEMKVKQRRSEKAKENSRFRRELEKEYDDQY